MLVEIFCELDDFCKEVEPKITKYMIGTTGRWPSSLSVSEVGTILIYYHLNFYKDFKHYYIEYVMQDLRRDFPDLVSYNRFVELIPMSYLVVSLFLLWRLRKSAHTGKSFVDSSKLEVCHPRRAHMHKVFDGLAQWGKTSTGWFYGLKYHIVINEKGELLSFDLTSGNVSDNNLGVLQNLTKRIWGNIFGDKGYHISKDKRDVLEKTGRIKLIAKPKNNMKGQKISKELALWLKKRSLVETVIDIHKNVCNIAHTRHRSPVNAIVHLQAGLTAYTFMQRKPKASGIDLASYTLGEETLKIVA